MSDRKQTATADEVAALKVLMSALEPFRAHNSTMPLQLAFTFLMVAADEGRPVSEYARAAGMAPGVMARNLLDLGDYNRRREPGLMLVEERIDPMDRRIHRKFLTQKGRALVGAISRAMERMNSGVF
jgi:DNA-binding MarR family transcriptional regulator